MRNVNIEALKKDIEEIKKRNESVKLDKKWETSYTRRALLIVFTYLAVGLYLRIINVSMPWLNAIVPSLGFLLSTLTLPIFKRIWINKLKSD